MSINFEQAFSYLKKDNQWVKKLLIGGLLMIVPTILNMLQTGIRPNTNVPAGLLLAITVFWFISIFTSIFVSGYFVDTIKDRMGEEDKILPEWNNWGEMFATGFKYFVGYFLYILPFVFVLIVLAMLIPLFKMIPFISIIIVPLLILVIIAMFLFTFVMTVNFAKDKKILSFVNYPEAFSLLHNNWGNYIFIVLANAALGIAYSIISFILILSKVGAVLLPFVSFYVMMVSADLLGQFNKTKKA